MSEPAVALSGAAAALPDINSETYPYPLVQHLLDQAAFFNLYSVSVGCRALESRRGGGVIGFDVREQLHRLTIASPPPDSTAGLRVSNLMGEPIARFEHRWLLLPDGYSARPDLVPPEHLLDSRASQRFVMLGSVFTLGDGADGFRGFGTGRTDPHPSGRSDAVLVGAVGTLLEGHGRFAGCDGTYTYCGELTPDGFKGSVLLRVMDPSGAFLSEALSSEPAHQPVPEPEVAYLLLAGRKSGPESRTNYVFDPAGEVVGLDVEQQLRLIDLDSGRGRDGGIRCATRIGPLIGSMTARIAFNLLKPGAPGTPLAPVPFSSYNSYSIHAVDGCPLGRFDADGSEGRTFNLELRGAPGQRALRFGGFGPLLNGQGRFAGIAGQMTDNSVVGVAPHALATTYVLRVLDPSCVYRVSSRRR